MAQEIGYFENDVEFKEGPFVISNPLSNGWRIEVELKDHQCPVLPDMSIYKLMKERFGLIGKTSRDEAVMICDCLNKMVLEEKIVLDGRCWVTN